jgi:hypothetical protein
MEAFSPQLIHHFLPEEKFKNFVRFTDDLREKNFLFLDRDEQFKRYYINGLSLFRDLHLDLNPWLEKTLNRKTKPSYTFYVEYEDGGFCPKHKDRPPCKYTITICLKQSSPFPLWIEGESYYMDENSLLLYSGTDHLHERIMVKEGYTRLILLHYVDWDYQGEMV